MTNFAEEGQEASMLVESSISHCCSMPSLSVEPLKADDMLNSKLNFFTKAVEKVLYVLLTCIGFYFIHNGQVWDRYRLNRTNYAEYTEKITELPTFVTWVQYHQNVQSSEYLKFGEDISIVYWQYPWLQQTVLQEGNNLLPSLVLKLEMKDDNAHYWISDKKYKLTPLNFTKDLLTKEFRLTFQFPTNKHSVVSGIKIALSTGNNSGCAYGWDTFDGEITRVLAKLGDHKRFLIKPEKYIYSRYKEECREKPFYDIEVDKIANYMKEHCSTSCRQKNYWICNSNLEKLLPFCNTNNESNCFFEAFKTVHEQIEIKPCTKVQYQVVEDVYPFPSDQVEFVFYFTRPPLVTVKEEYVIYDFVAMVSAVGGTMGLCIGFSFVTVTNCLLSYIELGIHFLNKLHKKTTPPQDPSDPTTQDFTSPRPQKPVTLLKNTSNLHKDPQ